MPGIFDGLVVFFYACVTSFPEVLCVMKWVCPHFILNNAYLHVKKNFLIERNIAIFKKSDFSLDMLAQHESRLYLRQKFV